MLRYNYTHTGTEATTGYFSAEPDPTPGFADALRYLAEHPLDDFMRRHLIRRMAPLPLDELRRILESAFAQRQMPAPVEALAHELALLNPDLTPLVPKEGPASDLAAATPLVFLRWKELPDKDLHRRWGSFFNANIQEHRALKSPDESGLPPLYPEDLQEGTGADGPGLSPAFLREFPHGLNKLYLKYQARQSGPACQRPPSEETAALAEERLAALGLIAGPEMRHTASLSPIALLRPWRVRLSITQGRHAYTLEGQATTYGRGLSLADARASCLMEMVERASCYLSVADGHVLHRQTPLPVVAGSRSDIVEKYGRAIDPNDFPLEVPYRGEPLVWAAGAAPDGSPTYVPVQMVGLFCNLDETALYDSPGSTGIATGCSMEEAKLAALLEILERDAEAVTPFHKSSCFMLEADPQADPLVAALLSDYAARGINVQFQALDSPMGICVYSCFVMSPKGAIASGHGAGLSAARALVSAMTETPFPYPDGGPSGPMLRKLPTLRLRDFPDYSLPRPQDSLAMLEELFTANGRPPVYVDLTHESLKFPVVRALVPGMELAADRDSFSRVPVRLWRNYQKIFEKH